MSRPQRPLVRLRPARFGTKCGKCDAAGYVTLSGNRVRCVKCFGHYKAGAEVNHGTKD